MRRAWEMNQPLRCVLGDDVWWKISRPRFVDMELLSSLD